MADHSLLAPAWLLALPLAWLLPWWIGHRGLGLPRLSAPLAVRHPAAADPAAPASAPGGRADPLLAAVLVLLCLALAQPVRLGPPLPPAPVPLDVVLLVDTSVSMGLADYELDGKPVERLTLARGLLDRVVAGLEGGRVGLVVVGAPSAVWLPLSADRALARHLLGRIEVGLAGRNAAVGDALALTAERFAGGGDLLALLISDGATPLGRLSPAEGAERLRGAGITLHSIAVGAAGEGPVGQGRGDLIFVPADLALLETVARVTGGELFRARDAAALGEALAGVTARHRAARPAPEASRRREPLYPWPLAAALLLLAAWPWWSGRRLREARA